MANSSNLVLINDKIYSEKDAVISVYDRGFLYGDSIYEVLRTYNGRPLFMDEHLSRLSNSAEMIELKIPFDKSALKDKTFQLIAAMKDLNPNSDFYIRTIVTRGSGPFHLSCTDSRQPQLIMIGQALTCYPKDWYEKGVHFICAKTRRNHKDALNPNIKSGNYLNNILAMIEAKKANAFDAIMLNHEGHVTEGTTNNLWFVKDNIVHTPSVDCGILAGITRATILKLCEENEIKFIEGHFGIEAFKNADECFFTSSTKEVVPINQIDGSKIGNGVPGLMTTKIHKLYIDYLNSLI